MGSFRAGKIISADALNRAEDLAERSGTPATGGIFETVRTPIGNLQRVIKAPGSISARITGKILVDGSATPPAWCYSGYQEFESIDGPTEDQGGGISFFADTFPLVELTGSADVPIDGTKIVRAWPGSGGGFYVFLLSSTADECTIPEDATAADPTGIYGVTCDPKCCRADFIEEQCSDDGTHTQWRRTKIYFPFKVKMCRGEWEDHYPPSDWDPCEPPPTFNFSGAAESGYVVLM